MTVVKDGAHGAGTEPVDALMVVGFRGVARLAGSPRAAIEQGLIQREIQESAYRAQQAIDSGRTIVVGVNRFQLESEASIQVLRIDPALDSHNVFPHRIYGSYRKIFCKPNKS